jgi:hypothetical protein
VSPSETSPADAIAAMRSWPRRYRTELLPVDDPALETRAVTIGANGVSATDLAADTVRSLTVLERALHDVLISDDPVLHPAIVDRSARRWDAAVAEAPAAVLAQLDDVAESFAAAIERTDASEWTRTGTCSGRPVSALDLVGEAVDTAAANLREMVAVLASLD